MSRTRWIAVVAGLTVAVALSAGGPSGVSAAPAQDPDLSEEADLPAAQADSPWWPEYESLIEYGTIWSGFLRQVGFEKLIDARSDFINVETGRRATWEPPPCPECPRFTVWFFGSSTGFGLGQRDDGTVPSELAKSAWERGVALEVVNRSSPGDQHSQQADRFGWDLTRFDAPDAVVFYSGVSELNVAMQLGHSGIGDVDRPIDLIGESFIQGEPIRSAIDQHLRGGPPPDPPDGVRLADSGGEPVTTPDEIAQLAMRRYERSLPMSRDLVELYGMAGLWVWEPMRLSRPPTDGEPTREGDEQIREMVETAAAGVPDGVLNLSDVLADDPRPFFYDDVHHNEAASELIGAAIAQVLVPELLAGPRGS